MYNIITSIVYANWYASVDWIIPLLSYLIHLKRSVSSSIEYSSSFPLYKLISSLSVSEKTHKRCLSSWNTWFWSISHSTHWLPLLEIFITPLALFSLSLSLPFSLYFAVLTWLLLLLFNRLYFRFSLTHSIHISHGAQVIFLIWFIMLFYFPHIDYWFLLFSLHLTPHISYRFFFYFFFLLWLLHIAHIFPCFPRVFPCICPLNLFIIKKKKRHFSCTFCWFSGVRICFCFLCCIFCLPLV